MLDYLFKLDNGFKCEDVDYIIGDCGSGKTTYAVSQACKYLRQGHTVYSNIFIPGCFQFDLDDFMKYQLDEDCIIIIDEGATNGLASRGDLHKNSNKPNIVEGFTMYRHYKIKKIIVISPSFQDCIPIVRARVSTISVCKSPVITSLLLLPINIVLKLNGFVPIKVTLVKFVNKKIVIPKSNDNNSQSEPIESYFWNIFKRKYVLCNKYYDNFDSYSKKKLIKKIFKRW